MKLSRRTDNFLCRYILHIRHMCSGWMDGVMFGTHCNANSKNQSNPAWPIGDEPHVSVWVERRRIGPRVGGRQEALGFPTSSLLTIVILWNRISTNQCNLALMGNYLSVVERVKGWSWEGDEEEGVVARAGKKRSMEIQENCVRFLREFRLRKEATKIKKTKETFG